jgi:penicillin-binding protein 2
MLATPLQIAAANATIANGGTRFVPGLVEKVGDELVEPIQASDSLESSSIQIVREGMRQAVTKGSARSLSTLSQTVAGKTGTAQAPGDVPTHAWFEGFGPYEDPTLSVVVLIENGGEGSSVAVPIAKDIFEWWFANRPNG